MESSIKDGDLAGEVRGVETGELGAAAARQQMREAIERRYTLPA